MWNLTRRHPDDEALIAHLDGELESKADRKLAAHVKACWQCRTRLAQIEEQVHGLTEARERRTFPGAQRIEASRRRFASRFEELQEEIARENSEPAPHPSGARRRWALAGLCTAGAVAAIVFLAIWLKPGPRPTRAAASEILAATQAVENQLFDSSLPVHQVLRVEAAETSVPFRRAVSRLEVWSDSSANRFASRWDDESGVVRCALWRPEPGQEYTYFRAAGTTVHGADAPLFLTDAAGADLDRFHEAFLRWLGTNRWRPVSLSAEAAHFAGLDGATLRLRRIASGDGAALRLTVRRQSAQGVAEVILEVDEASHRPRTLELRYQGAGRTMWVRLVSEKMETVIPALLPATAFHPNLPEFSGALGRSRPPRLAAPKPPAPSAEDLDTAEVRVLYALHQTGSCLGDAVELAREPSGIQVRGLVATAERKRRLLSELAEAPYVVVRLQSVDERARTAASRKPASPLEIRVEKSAIADRLEEVLSRSSPENVQFRAGEVSSEAVSTAQSALSEAWALRRLAEWSRPEITERLTVESKRMLSVMVRDHAAALRKQIARQESLLTPILGPVTAPVADSGGAADRLPQEWQRASRTVFDTVAEIERLALALFARAGSNPTQTDETIRALLAKLGLADSQLQALDLRLAALPRDSGAHASGNRPPH